MANYWKEWISFLSCEPSCIAVMPIIFIFPFFSLSIMLCFCFVFFFIFRADTSLSLFNWILHNFLIIIIIIWCSVTFYVPGYYRCRNMHTFPTNLYEYDTSSGSILNWAFNWARRNNMGIYNTCRYIYLHAKAAAVQEDRFSMYVFAVTSWISSYRGCNVCVAVSPFNIYVRLVLAVCLRDRHFECCSFASCHRMTKTEPY